MARKRIERGMIHIVWPSGASVKLTADSREVTPEEMTRFAATCDRVSETLTTHWAAAHTKEAAHA